MPAYLPVHLPAYRPELHLSRRGFSFNELPGIAVHTSSAENILHTELNKHREKNKNKKNAGTVNQFLSKLLEARFLEAVSSHHLPLFQVGVVWHLQLSKGWYFM